jgi:putative FmdB family regulatory protein
MPIYEYRCPKGHEFEVVQRMTDEPVSECEVCGEPVERIFSPVAVHYKGSGFYTTDYARKAKSEGEKKDSSGKKNEGSGGKDSANKSKSSQKASAAKD